MTGRRLVTKLRKPWMGLGRFMEPAGLIQGQIRRILLVALFVGHRLLRLRFLGLAVALVFSAGFLGLAAAFFGFGGFGFFFVSPVMLPQRRAEHAIDEFAGILAAEGFGQLDSFVDDDLRRYIFLVLQLIQSDP